MKREEVIKALKVIGYMALILSQISLWHSIKRHRLQHGEKVAGELAELLEEATPSFFDTRPNI